MKQENVWQLWVRTTNPKTYTELVIKIGKLGGSLREDNYPSLSGIPLTAKFDLTINKVPDELLSSLDITAVPVRVFLTRDEMETLSWEDFRSEVRRATGQTGRDRAVLMDKYFSEADGVDVA